MESHSRHQENEFGLQIQRVTPRSLRSYRGVSYRNFDEKSCEDCIKLGVTIVHPDLTRFDRQHLTGVPRH